MLSFHNRFTHPSNAIRLMCYDDATPARSHTEAAAEPRFTQAELNSIVAQERRNFEAKTDKQKAALQGTLENLLNDNELNTNQRENIEELISDIKISRQKFNEVLSDREKKYAAALTAKDQEKQSAIKDYGDYRVQRDIEKYADAMGAFDPLQVIKLIGDQAQFKRADVDPITQEKRPDRVVGIDAEGKEIPVAELVKATLEAAPNLQKSTLKPGIGSYSHSGFGSGVGGPADVRNLSPSQYMELRKTNPAALGLDPKKMAQSR